MTKLDIDPITHKKVAIAKKMYEKAFLQSFAQSNPVNCIMSVIGFDLAVETLLKTAVVFLGYAKDLKNLSNFDNLLTETKNCLSNQGLGLFPDEAKIRRIRNIRNAAQHEARTPNSLEVNECRTWAKNFLDLVVDQIWEKSFDLISISDFIENEEVKNLLINSEKEYRLKNWDKAILQATTGLLLILNPLKISFNSSNLTLSDDDIKYLTGTVRDLQEMLF
jgi:hypothetical protein